MGLPPGRRFLRGEVILSILPTVWPGWASQMICPQCRSTDCFRSRREGLVDFLWNFWGLRPWRCHTC
ncbi:MAG: hypothetical protein ACRD5R_06960, partial [Candidatus Acidiferrales bacterium]